MKFDKGIMIPWGKKKDERERRERERLGEEMKKKGRRPYFIFAQWAPGRHGLAAWAPTYLKLIIL